MEPNNQIDPSLKSSIDDESFIIIEDLKNLRDEIKEMRGEVELMRNELMGCKNNITDITSLLHNVHNLGLDHQKRLLNFALRSHIPLAFVPMK